MKTVTLIQPQSPWGKHPYLPNGLLSVAARLETKDIQVKILDENLGEHISDPETRKGLARSDVIGIGSLGSPYIPETIRVGKTLRQMGFSQPIMIGGEVIMKLSPEEFERIFSRIGGNVQQILSDDDLGVKFGLTLPSMYDVSMRGAIEGLTGRVQRAYFEKEWCLFTDQHCKFNCDFCAAPKAKRQRFRSLDAFADEVDCLAAMTRHYAGGQAPYEVYCSTLDGCQTPEQMEDRLQMFFLAARKYCTKIPLRFLATAQCTLEALEKDPSVLQRWRGYGLQCIGIGADGPGRGNTRKHKKSRAEEDRAFTAIKQAGIQAEATMVIGLPSDGDEAFVEGLARMRELVANGVRPRPLMGKETVPGNGGWKFRRDIAEQFLKNPNLFKELDFGGLGSPVTHPNTQQRRQCNRAFFSTIMELKLSKVGCPTQPLLPTESVSRTRSAIGHIWNRLMPQDR